MNDFSTQLKLWRLVRGFTQAELARKAGIPRPNLIDIETGKRDCTLRTLQALAKALGLSPGKLLDELPPQMKELDRHELDRLARSFFENDKTLSLHLQFLKKALSPLIEPILKSVGKDMNAYPRVKYSKLQAEALMGREGVARFVNRINKLAEPYA